MDEIMRKPLHKYILCPDGFDYSKAEPEMMDIIRENGVRNMIITKKMNDFTAALDKKNIPYVLLKGCHLIHEIYPFGIRPLEDVDILIDPQRFSDATQILKDLNYSECTESMNTWINISFANKMTFVDNLAPKIPIDVHLSLGPYPYLGKINNKTIFSNTQLIKTDPSFLCVLNNELLLVHLCLHAFSHLYENYVNSCFDIITVIRQSKENIDWEKFISIISSNNLSLPFIEVNNLLEKLEFLNVFPEHVMDSILKIRLKRFEKYFLQLISSPNILNKILLIPTLVYPGKKFLEVHFSGSYFKYIKISFTAVLNTFKRSKQ